MPVGPKSAVKVWDRERVVEHRSTSPPSRVTGSTTRQRAQARRLQRGLVETPPYRMRSTTASAKRGDCAPCRTVCRCRRSTPAWRQDHDRSVELQSRLLVPGRRLPQFHPITPNPKAEKKWARVPSAAISPIRPHRCARLLDLRMVGIGGTGVVTVAQIVATAAMLDGLHVRGSTRPPLAESRTCEPTSGSRPTPAPSNLIGDEGADVIIAFDLLGAASPPRSRRATRHARC